MATKICSKCNEEKDTTLFVKNPTAKDGYKSYCKVCDSIASKARRERYRSGQRIEREGKICPTCKEYKKASDYPKNSHSADGLASECRICTGIRCKKAREKREPKEPTVSSKICPYCKVDKSATEFYKAPKRGDGLSHSCKVCHIAKIKENDAKNPEKRKKRDRKRYKKNMEEDSEGLKEKYRKYRHKNADHYREYYRKYRDENRVKWRKSMVVAQHRRRARLRELPDTLTTGEAEALLKHFDNECALCNSNQSIDFDHIIPVSRDDIPNPGTVLENMLPLCRQCNGSKNDRTLEEYLKDPSRWLSPGLRELSESSGMSGDEIYDALTYELEELCKEIRTHQKP